MQINILEYFEKTVQSNSLKDAIVDGTNRITFGELSERSIVLASELSKFNIVNKPIAVYLPKSVESVIADIAITYSANAYMNLDVKTPIARISNIIERIKPEIIITNSKLLPQIYEINQDIEIIVIDKFNFNQTVDIIVLHERLNNIIDTDPLCLINTSGSTGTPKGVVLNHRSFIDFTEWAVKILKISDIEIVGSLSPLVFDIYSFELCMLMSRGSTIVLLPDTFAAFPAKLLEILKSEMVSFIFWVPTIMVNIANLGLLEKIQLTHLKTVWFAGEVFPTKQFKYWKNNLLETKFVNLYGPIEITLDCTYYIVERELQDEEPIPIGFPCRNTDILILNESNELVEGDEEGELCVRGSSLAMGYYNNPEKTSVAFVQNPLNTSYPEIIYRTGDIVYRNSRKEIIFKGRKDSLIKHLGYRIELGEIEHVIINVLKLVRNGCVVYNFNKKEITLYYESNELIDIVDLKKSLVKVFPKYMVPTAYFHMDELPRNTNGKIDRLKLNLQINNG